MASESKLDLSETNSDLPPESFCVPTNDEQDWFNRNAVMQRKMSMKLGSNRKPNSFPHRSDVHSNAKLSKPSVIGLPKVRASSLLDGSPPEKKSGRFLFRNRSEPVGKSAVHASEPGSPRVSCTGRVESKSGDGKKTGVFFSCSLFGIGSGKKADCAKEKM